MDVVVLLDGSGSLYYRYRPIDRNWELEKRFRADLIANSKMATMDDEGRASGGLRFGVILFSWGAQVVSPITHKKDELVSKIKGMKWPRGWTFTDKALLKAKDMFAAGSTVNRQQIVMLLTDGRASNRYRAWLAAGTVRKAGIRIILIPVKNALRMKRDMCSW